MEGRDRALTRKPPTEFRAIPWRGAGAERGMKDQRKLWPFIACVLEGAQGVAGCAYAVTTFACTALSAASDE